MSADRLREAARVLRDRAEGAACASGSPWVMSPDISYRPLYMHPDDSPADVFHCDICEWEERGSGLAATAEETATYIATMDPDLGLALADWLDAAARDEMAVAQSDRYPLAVADLILGGTR